MKCNLKISSMCMFLIESIEVHHVFNNVKEECHVHLCLIVICVVGVWVELLLEIFESLQQKTQSEHWIVTEI